MEKNTIKKMRDKNIRGITGQNGYNDHFYRIYDEDGRIAGSKEGIVTVPSEMMPRQAHVEVNLDGFKPTANFDSMRPVDQTFQPRSAIEAEGRNAGDTWTVQKQNWRNTPAQGELAKFEAGGYDAKHRPTPKAPVTPPAPTPTTKACTTCGSGTLTIATDVCDNPDCAKYQD